MGVRGVHQATKIALSLYGTPVYVSGPRLAGLETGGGGIAAGPTLLAAALVWEADPAAHDAVLAHLRRGLVLLPPGQVAGVCRGQAAGGWARLQSRMHTQRQHKAVAFTGTVWTSPGVPRAGQ